jgi:hemerythrin superfamily protein
MTAATARKSASDKRSTKAPRRFRQSAASSSLDAIKLLTADHREVKGLFQEYQALVDHEAQDDEKQPIAHQICEMLTIHATIEEEIFYPAAQASIKEPDLVDEANVEHASAKDLIAQLEA